MNRRAPTIAVVACLLLLLVAAAPALAHAELVSSDPEAGSTVTDVGTVTLKFSEALSADESSFKLVGPDGTTIGTGAVVSPRTMKLEGLSLGPGDYTVKWTSAATDGHIERGKFSFTVDGPAPATPTPATPTPATPAPATPTPANESPAASGPVATVPPTISELPTDAPATVPAAAATPAASAAPVTEPASSASGTDVLLPIIGALVIVGIVGALVLRRSRRA